MTECRRIERWADRLLAGTLSAARRAPLEAHLTRCAECRAVHDAIVRPAALDFDLVPSLRARQASGCAPVRDALAGGAAIEAEGHEHLARCTPCARFAAALRLADETLPEMARLEPGAAFTWQVLEATTAAESARPPRRQTLGEWVQRQLRRPRFAFELSYAFMLLLVVGFGTPVSPGAGVPARALAWFEAWIDAGEEPPRWVEAGIVPIASSPVRLVTATGAVGGEVTATIGTRKAQVEPVLGSLGGHLGEFRRALTEREWTRVRLVAGEMQCDMTLLLRGIRGRLREPSDLEC